jgi:hypothetical protein
LWDEYPVIDGCASGALHSLVREPQAQLLVLAQPPDAIAVAPARVVDLAGALGDEPIDVIACTGVTTAAERGGEALALGRARGLIEVLAPRFRASRFVVTARVGDAPAIEIAVVSRGGHEELRWSGSGYEHVLAAAARARLAEARGVTVHRPDIFIDAWQWDPRQPGSREGGGRPWRAASQALVT